jgi:hypothetical protein
MKKIKLSKDQIQKVVLSTLGFVALLYVYFSFFLGPLNKSRNSMLATIADLQDKVRASKSEIAKASNLERQASAATARFADLKARSPEGAPIAWFPPRMKTFFASKQMDKATVRLGNSDAFKESELADWMKYAWEIELPRADYAALGKALAELENTEPLFSITKLGIHAVPDDPKNQLVDLTIVTAIVKR